MLLVLVGKDNERAHGYVNWLLFCVSDEVMTRMYGPVLARAGHPFRLLLRLGVY